MKFLLVLAVLLVAFWIWRNNRIGQDRSETDAPRRPPAGGERRPVVMVACRHCDTHLPETEAVTGRQGVYCCHEHRRQHEGAGGA